jgi:copper transport protein
VTTPPVRPTRILLGALAALLLLAALLPAGALAHAQLERTSPGRDALVATQPKLVTFTFGEPVTGTAGAVRVYDTKGDRVDDGDARHPGDDAKTFGVGLRPNLRDGTYTATYRVVSADSHVVTGGFSFSIGTRSAGTGETVGQLLAGQRTGAVTSDAFIVVRAVQYGAIAVGVGGLAFLLLVLLAALTLGTGPDWTAASARSLRRLRLALVVAAAAGALVSAAGHGLEAAEAAGVTFWNALDSTILGDVLDTRFGGVWAAAIVVWILVGVGALAILRPTGDGSPPPRARLLALLVPAAALLLLPGVAGHSSVQSPVWLLLPANVVHVAAMSVWVGGLVALVLVLPAATRALPERTDRTRLLAGALARFSPIALGCVIALLLTGIVQSLVEISAWSQLLHAAFGRAVLIKFLLLLVLIGLGAVNRRRTVPRLERLAATGGTPGETGVVLRRTLRLEVLLVTAVLVVTGALAGYPPAKVVASGPVQITTTIGPEQLSLTVDPARVGANEIHLYLLDPKSGAQFDGTKQLTLTASLPKKGIGPLPLAAEHAGPGHYVVTSAVLGAPGTWTLHVTDRVSEFDEYAKDVKVEIR